MAEKDENSNGYLGFKTPKRAVYLLSEAYRITRTTQQYEKFFKMPLIEKMFTDLAAMSEKYHCKDFVKHS